MLWPPHESSPHTANGQSRGPKAPCRIGALCLPAPCLPHCSSSLRVGPSLPSVLPGTLKGAAPLAAVARVGWPSPVGLLSTRRDLTCCPPPRQTGSPSVPGTAGRGFQTQPTPRTLCPWLNRRPVQFRAIPVLPRPEERNPRKRRKAFSPKQCLSKSLRFSFFLEVVEYCLFSALSEMKYLEKALFL